MINLEQTAQKLPQLLKLKNSRLFMQETKNQKYKPPDNHITIAVLLLNNYFTITKLTRGYQM